MNKIKQIYWNWVYRLSGKVQKWLQKRIIFWEHALKGMEEGMEAIEKWENEFE